MCFPNAFSWGNQCSSTQHKSICRRLFWVHLVASALAFPPIIPCTCFIISSFPEVSSATASGCLLSCGQGAPPQGLVKEACMQLILLAEVLEWTFGVRLGLPKMNYNLLWLKISWGSSNPESMESWGDGIEPRLISILKIRKEKRTELREMCEVKQGTVWETGVCGEMILLLLQARWIAELEVKILLVFLFNRCCHMSPVGLEYLWLFSLKDASTPWLCVCTHCQL